MENVLTAQQLHLSEFEADKDVVFGCKWWHMTVIPARGNWRQADHEFEIILGFIASFGPVWFI